jgi:hypothetical protein
MPGYGLTVLSTAQLVHDIGVRPSVPITAGPAIRRQAGPPLHCSASQVAAGSAGPLVVPSVPPAAGRRTRRWRATMQNLLLGQERPSGEKMPGSRSLRHDRPFHVIDQPLPTH